jgi:hypothetical protein
MITAICNEGRDPVNGTPKVKNQIYHGAMEFNSFEKWFLEQNTFLGKAVKGLDEIKINEATAVVWASAKKSVEKSIPPYVKIASQLHNEQMNFWVCSSSVVAHYLPPDESGLLVFPKGSITPTKYTGSVDINELSTFLLA